MAEREDRKLGSREAGLYLKRFGERSGHKYHLNA